MKGRWRERKEKYDAELRVELKEAERAANKNQELLAQSLVVKANEIRCQSAYVQSTNNNYLAITTSLDESDAGPLNLSSCCPISSESASSELIIACQKAAYYRDMAEDLKAEN